MRIVRQTWQQVETKAAMGLFRGVRSFEVKFHWQFWKPLDVLGGKVWFGKYGEHDADDPALAEPAGTKEPACAESG